MPEPWLQDLSKKKRKKPKTSAKTAKTKADAAFSRLIRSVGECEYCGNQANLQTAHWLSRRYSNIRTDFDNAFCLCAGCHRFFTADPTAWTDWAILQRGRATYDRLREAANKHSEINWTDELTRLQEMEKTQ